MLFPCAHASVNNGAGILKTWVRSGHSASYKRGCLKSPNKAIARQPTPNPQGSVNPCKGGRANLQNLVKSSRNQKLGPKGREPEQRITEAEQRIATKTPQSPPPLCLF